jgi:hypothetical protein
MNSQTKESIKNLIRAEINYKVAKETLEEAKKRFR